MLILRQETMAPSWPSSGGGEDQGEQLPGSGGSLAPLPRPRVKIHPTENQTSEDAGRQRGAEGPAMGDPLQGLTGTW